MGGPKDEEDSGGRRGSEIHIRLNRSNSQGNDSDHVGSLSPYLNSFNSRLTGEEREEERSWENPVPTSSNVADGGSNKEKDGVESTDEGTDDEENNDADGKIDANRRRLIRHLLNKKKILKYEAQPNDDEAFRVFVEDYESKARDCMIDNKDPKDRTLLHYLANRKDLKPKLHRTPFTWLTKLILKIDKYQAPTLLSAASDHSGSILCIVSTKEDGANTCLHVALALGRVKFVKYICSVADASLLGQAIATPNGRGQTVLHLAITNVNPPDLELLWTLTEKANKDTFVMVRGRTGENAEGEGNTPLHDLINFRLSSLAADRKCPIPHDQCDQCKKDKETEKTASYMKVLRMMVERGPTAVAKLNKASESPYLFHISTRDKLKNGVKEWRDLEFTDAPTPKPPVLRPAATDGRALSQYGNKVDDRRSSKGEQTTSHKSHVKQTYDYSPDFSREISRYLMDESLSQENFADTYTALFGKSKLSLLATILSCRV
jgi:hypothetical protein